MKNVVVLGSTGSVGRSALEVIRSLNGACALQGIAAKSNWELMAEQVRTFRPKVAALYEPEAAQQLSRLEGLNGFGVFAGSEGIRELIAAPDVNFVFCGIGGAEALPFVLHTLEMGKTLALVNKESLVVAGKLLKERAHRSGAQIIPVDSEHSAIFQAIRGHSRSEVRRIFLTSSGGPFVHTPKHKLEKVTPAQALRHPIWNMGNKITIDSATMMNKALEIIEAQWLFDVRPSQIEILIHPQSIIHSMVEFCDGSVLAQMSVPDMRFPIQYALTYPERKESNLPRLDLTVVKQLSFEKPDFEKFPALRLGYQAAEAGGTMGAVLNAANEVAVQAFLESQIPFLRIAATVEQIMQKHQVVREPTLKQILSADKWARAEARKAILARRESKVKACKH